jgi:hypothetical protein
MAATRDSDAPRSMTHRYGANSCLLTGRLKRPVELKIEAQAAVSLHGDEASRVTRHMELYSADGLISFRSGYTCVSGNDSEQHGWVTLSTSVLEGLNVLEVITAERVVAQVSTEHGHEGPYPEHVPKVTFLGTRFEDLRVCGYPVQVELDLGICGDRPRGDQTYLEDRSFLSRVQHQLENIVGTEGLPDAIRRQYHSKIGYIHDLNKRSNRRADGDSKLQCSLGRSIGAIPFPGVRTFGNLILIPDFGIVSLAELEVIQSWSKEFGVTTNFGLTMLNLVMGSIAEGEVEVAKVGLTGATRLTEANEELHRYGSDPEAIPQIVTADRTVSQVTTTHEPVPDELGGESASELREGREITVTAHSLDGIGVSHFKAGDTYRLRFRVGPPAMENLAVGDTTVKDIPASGLKTHWVVTSTSVEFVPALSTVNVQKIGNTWLAEFDLLIPERGSSQTEEVALLAGVEAGKLLVTIYAVSADDTREVYREVSVSLADRLAVEADEVCKAPKHTHLRTTHEWTTPPVHIQVSVMNGMAAVSTKRAQLEVYEFFERFAVTDNLISGAIQSVQRSLERLREAQEIYLNDLDDADIAARLAGAANWRPDAVWTNGWQPLPESTDPSHKALFSKVQQSAEWRTLASDGYALFDQCFPPNTRIREVLEKLVPGSRIDFHWSPESGPGWVSHVPWALMHLEPVDVTGQRLADPEKFLGLRFRIGTRSWNVHNGSVALGGPDATHSMNLLYWGNKPGDDVAVEARWQAAEYGKWKQSTMLPDPARPNLKDQIIQALDVPMPAPVGVIYLYCHCSVGDGSQPTLRFGNTSKGEDTVGRAEMSQKSMPDAPIVFANACTTAQADPHMTGELEQRFFRRGARAFIGTETKVPIKLASKFAWLFFQFFYRRIDPDPMSAGEALTQARMFLWTQYKNVGGLFYSMANQYDLYLASDAEVLGLR